MARHWPLAYPFATIVGRDGKPIERDGFVLEKRPGDFRYLDEKGEPTRDQSAVRMFEFYCPKPATAQDAPGRLATANYCGRIRAAFHVKPPQAPSWLISGSLDAPTLQPSIDCKGCWHGYVNAGNFKKA